MRNIYIVLSRTETGVAHILRRLGHLHYNHASVSLDRDLTEMYSFARREKYGYLTSGCIHETTDRFLVNASEGIEVSVFEIPVTDEQYEMVRKSINEILADPKYHYNFFSVLTHPVLKGFPTWKAYSCIEFVTRVLMDLNFRFDDPSWRVIPDDLAQNLDDYRIFTGNLVDYTETLTFSDSYFKSASFMLIVHSLAILMILIRRSVPGLRRFGRY